MTKGFVNLIPPMTVLAVVCFWALAPAAVLQSPWTLTVTSSLITLFVQGLEFVFERHSGWRMNWKEFWTDLFYVVLGATAISWVSNALAETPLLALKQALGIATPWAMQLPFLVQVALVIFLIEFGQYWMHRLMHNSAPFWMTHAPHHHITQLNALKGSVGNPIELFLIGLSLGGFFDFLPRAALLAGGIGMAIGAYTHANIRFNTPRWWSFLFNTVEHHSLHHSPDFDSSRTNYANTFIFIDRIFGTCVDSQSARVGLDDCRRLGIKEQMLYPFQPLFGWVKRLRAPRLPQAAVAAE